MPHLHSRPRHRRGDDDRRHERQGLMILLGLFVFIILLFGGCVKLLFGSAETPEDPLAYDPVTLEPKEPEGVVSKLKQLVLKKEATLAGEKKDRINFLALGQGGPGHDGPYLTDTIILGSFKPSTGQVAMIPIPRDLAVEIPDFGLGKINFANAYGESQERGSGPAKTKDVIEDLFDLDIHYYVRVDFAAFVDAIDAIGGVSIDVDNAFVDNQYPAANHLTQTISFREGIQQMNGERALQYARSRHGNNGEGSDFARSKRQQKLIVSLKDKVLSFDSLTNPLWIKEMLDIFRDHVVTNVGFSDMMQMLRMAREFDTNSIITLTLDNSEEGFLENSSDPNIGFILKPKAKNFKDIEKAIEDIFVSPPNLVYVATPPQQAPPSNSIIAQGEETPPPEEAAIVVKEERDIIPDENTVFVEVQNGTWRAGMASRVKKRLTEEDIYVPTIGNTETRPIAKSFVAYPEANDAAQNLAESIAQQLDMNAIDFIPEGILPTGSSDVLVILGEDFVE